ncbi:xylulokinase [Clostridia bacterium]|nr:xylulokinase [Clostridia bacterium]
MGVHAKKNRTNSWSLLTEMERKRFVIGADFGTSGVKAALIDTETDACSLSSLFEYPIMHKHPLWSEQDPKAYWTQFCAAIRELLDMSGADPELIACMAISSQGHGLVGIDRYGNDLGDSMIWQDCRSGDDVEWLKLNVPDEIRKTNGNAIKVLFPVPGILWEKRLLTEKYEATVKYLGVSSYINYKLTGNFTVNPCEASLTYLFEMTGVCWSDDLAEKIGIPISKFPDIYECTQEIGHVTQAAAAETGLAAGTIVIGGGHDTTSAALGMGIVRVGQAFYSMGTGSNLGVITDVPKYDAAMTVQRYVCEGMWIFDAVMNSTGYSMKWFSQQFGANVRAFAVSRDLSAYDIFSLEAEKAPAGSRGVLFHPYLAGESCPIWNENARASFVGMTGRTTRGDMIRSIMEGVCFSARHNLEVFEKCGCVIDEIVVCGGPAKSRVWMQILADVLGKRVLITNSQDTAPLGDAMLAGVATGQFSSFKDAAERVSSIVDSIDPIPANVAVYSNLFQVYKRIYESLKDVYVDLSNY